jgi:glutathione S-transferase
MTLALYGHPFSSYMQKTLIALYKTGVAFDFRMIGPDTPQHTAEWIRRWPMGAFPLLVGWDQSIVETSVIIEHLQIAHPGRTRLIPEDATAALDRD